MTALVGLGVTPVSAAAAQPARGAETCTLRLLTTKAVDLQHDVKGTDEVRAQLGNTTSRTRTYTVGQRRNTLSDGRETFTGSTQVSLQVEVLGGVWLPIDTRGIRCEDQTRDLVLSSNDARYKARAVVEVI
ncbi:hypothetical protein [Nocardioides sp. SR21]|uniref:hypothetical protein n=1 Tax=Nocardioides sp. SR21 TaxID=2919501 RepID=UPI001FAAF0FB|nr:hypothetical protein [Nocardioides sp. SR21]